MKKLQFGNAIVCEFATKSENNKHTLVNVFHGDIIVQAMPAQLSLAFYIEYVIRKDDPESLNLDFMLGEKRIARLFVSVAGGKLGVSALVVPRIDLKIENDLQFVIVASADGFTPHNVISKRIYKGTVNAN